MHEKKEERSISFSVQSKNASTDDHEWELYSVCEVGEDHLLTSTRKSKLLSEGPASAWDTWLTRGDRARNSLSTS